MTDQISIDQPRLFPVTSFEQHKYITVMIDLDAGYIIAAPIKSRKVAELVQCFQVYYDELKSNGMMARIIQLDNGIPATMITEFDRH